MTLRLVSKSSNSYPYIYQANPLLTMYLYAGNIFFRNLITENQVSFVIPQLRLL